MKLSLNELNAFSERIDTNTEAMQGLIESIVGKYCKELDDYMKQVDEALCKPQKPTTTQLEDMLLNINSMLYWVGNGLEQATVKEAMAKMVKEEQFNEQYNLAEGTIGDKKATATLNSQKEEVGRACYSAAVKLYQHKIDRASEFAASIKKILTHRIAEFDISRRES